MASKKPQLQSSLIAAAGQARPPADAQQREAAPATPTRPRKGATAARPVSETNKRTGYLNLRVDPELKRKFDIKARENDETMTDVLERMIPLYLEGKIK